MKRTAFLHSKKRFVRVYLRFDVQQCNLVLLMDLLNGLDLGAEHAALKTSVLQELVPHDASGHLVVGDEIIFLPVFFVFPRRSRRVWLNYEMFFIGTLYSASNLIQNVDQCFIFD